jgi:TPR repeat protein
MSMEKFVAMRELTRTCGLVLAALLSTAGAARADSGLGPADAEKTLGRLGYLCMIQSLCPLTAANYATLKRAVAGHRDDEYLLGLNLIHGDGLPTDHIAGVAWVVKAAEAGAPLAAGYVERHLQNGEHIEIDETKVAALLQRQADAGDIESMRALGLMIIRGRGLAQDKDAGIALLLKAAQHEAGGEIEFEIADLYLIGTNGLPHDHEEGMKWYAISASHGNLLAMATLGGLWENAPMIDLSKVLETGRIPEQTFEPDIVQSYCWRMRAAMMGMPLAQYELALMRTRRTSDRRGNVIAPDLIQADFWFRLGARDPEYDNSQVRGAIEPKMTTAQLDQVKKMVGDWHKLDFEQMKAAKIAVPGDAARTCPAMT